MDRLTTTHVRKTGECVGALARAFFFGHARGPLAVARRTAGSALAAAALAAIPAFAQAEADLLAELDEAAREAGVDLGLHGWDTSGGIEAAAGWRDNVNLASFEPLGSAFAAVAADAMAWRMPDDGAEWIVFFDGRLVRYFAGEAGTASLAVARGTGRWRPSRGLRLSLSGQYIFQEEFMDLSPLDALGTALVRGQTAAVIPAADWWFAPGWRGTATVIAERSSFRGFDGFGDAEAVVEVERSWGRRAAVFGQFGAVRRRYDDREQAAIGGRPLGGTRLAAGQRQAKAGWKGAGGSALAWEGRVEASIMQNRDNGTGWHDYDRASAEGSLALERGRWRIELEADWTEFDWARQTVGVGIDPPRRFREERTLRVRAERTLGGNTVAFVEAEGTDCRSNDILLEYTDLAVSTGLRWSR